MLSSASTARFLLVARSSEGMEDTKRELLSAVSEVSSSSSAATATTTTGDVLCRSMDLSDLDRLDANADLLVKDMERLARSPSGGLSLRQQQQRQQQQEQQQQQQQHLVFVNNAATLGHLGPSLTSPSLEDMRQTVDTNVTGSLWLSVRFARYAQELLRKQEQLQEQQQQQREQDRSRGGAAARTTTTTTTTGATLVNISSLVAVSNDFAGMGIYSAGKAARERYHSLMGVEGLGSGGGTGTTTKTTEPPFRWKTLNYAPGPLETDMTVRIKQTLELDEGLRSRFANLELLDPSDSALKLVKLLDENRFESGSHIDYYDLPE